MKFYVHRFLAELYGTDVLTHTLPYQVRLMARRTGRH